MKKKALNILAREKLNVAFTEGPKKKVKRKMASPQEIASKASLAPQADDSGPDRAPSRPAKRPRTEEAGKGNISSSKGGMRGGAPYISQLEAHMHCHSTAWYSMKRESAHASSCSPVLQVVRHHLKT